MAAMADWLEVAPWAAAARTAVTVDTATVVQREVV